MKLAIVSDIHSNVYALKSVLDDIERIGVDIKVNLGDILYGPIAPRATFDLLQQHEFVTICGNQDRQIFEAQAPEVAQNPTLAFILQDLGSQPLEWMRSLPFEQQLSPDVYLCHGTPTSDLVYLLENIESGAAVLREDSEIITLLAGQRSALICCGHTHTPRVVSLTTGQIVVNPGSVGLPAYTDEEPVVHSMETYSSHARYAIATLTPHGWDVEQRSVAYDVEPAIAACRQQGRHDWAHFLTTGRRQESN